MDPKAQKGHTSPGGWSRRFNWRRALFLSLVVVLLACGLAPQIGRWASPWTSPLVRQLEQAVGWYPIPVAPQVRASASLICSYDASPPTARLTWPSLLSWSPDGRWVVSECGEALSSAGEAPMFVYLLDARTLHVVAQTEVATGGAVCGAWSGNGTMLAVPGPAKSVALFRMPQGSPGSVFSQQPIAHLSGPSERDALSGCAFSPDDQWFTALAHDDTAQAGQNGSEGSQVAVAWGVGTWDVMHTLSGPVTGNLVSSLGWSPDGRSLASAEAVGRTARIWVRSSLPPEQWPSVEVSSATSKAVFVGMGDTRLVWLPGPNGGTTSSQLGCLVAASNYSVACYLRVVTPTGPAWTNTLPESNTLPIVGVTALRHQQIAVVTPDQVYVLDAAEGSVVRNWRMGGVMSNYPVTSTASSPDGALLVLGSGDRVVEYDMSS